MRLQWLAAPAGKAGLELQAAIPTNSRTRPPAARVFATAMPIYAFECPHCGHSFDRLQKLSDADPTQCPACDQAGVRRQLTAPSFRLAEPAAKPEAAPAAKPADTKSTPSG